MCGGGCDFLFATGNCTLFFESGRITAWHTRWPGMWRAQCCQKALWKGVWMQAVLNLSDYHNLFSSSIVYLIFPAACEANVVFKGNLRVFLNIRNTLLRVDTAPRGIKEQPLRPGVFFSRFLHLDNLNCACVLFISGSQWCRCCVHLHTPSSRSAGCETDDRTTAMFTVQYCFNRGESSLSAGTQQSDGTQLIQPPPPFSLEKPAGCSHAPEALQFTQLGMVRIAQTPRVRHPKKNNSVLIVSAYSFLICFIQHGFPRAQKCHIPPNRPLVAKKEKRE